MKIVKMGYLLERDNPKVKFDNTKQYRVNLLKIIHDLNLLGYHLEGYKTAQLLNRHNVHRKRHNVQSESHNSPCKGHNVGTIPEITTETTTKNTVSKRKVNNLSVEEEQAILDELAQKRKNKTDRQTEPSKVRQAIEQEWKMNKINPNIIIELRKYSKKLSDDIVAEAIARSKFKEEPFTYCVGILENCVERGVTSVSDMDKKSNPKNNKKMNIL